LADASDQLKQELEWLRGEAPGSLLAVRANFSPPDHWVSIAKRIETVLLDVSSNKLLAILDKHNAEIRANSLATKDRFPPNREAHKQKGFYLLAPQIFRIVHSVESRSDVRNVTGASEYTAGKLRSHLLAASAKSKTLAALLRRHIQPRVALAAHHDDYELLQTLLPVPIIYSDGDVTSLVELDEVLDKAARQFDSIATRITRATPNRRPSKRPKKAQKEELRSQIASSLVRILRERLDRPCYDHVAAIAHLLTNVPTDADYVKKVATRGER
jgi:hypothetical protein